MPIVASPQYNNPAMGNIVSNLAAAIYGDPEARMKAGYYGAETNNANASAAKSGAETTGINLKNAAVAGLPDVTAALAPLPNESAQDHFTRIAPLLGRIAQAGGGNTKDMADGFNTLIGNVFANGNVDDQGRSLVMQGKNVGKDFAPTVARSDIVAGRDARLDEHKAVAVANIDQAGATGRTKLEQAGQLSRVFAAPVVSRPGDTTYLSPDDPRRAVMGTNGVVEGAPTVDTVRAGAGKKILALPAGTAPSTNLADVFSGKASGSTPAKPKSVTAKNMEDAVAAAAGMLKGATTAQPNGKPPIVDPDFESSFDPAKVAAARTAASTVLAASGDAQRAGAAYLDALGVQPGSSYSTPHSGLGAMIFGKGGVAAPTVAAAPAAPVPQGLLPPAQRPLNYKQTNSQGHVGYWTGQGWSPTPVPQQPVT